MEELKTITQVTKAFGISTRTLRYYEQIGLLTSKRMDGYSYRVYDEESCIRLHQIIILRKLRIPLKQISDLLTDDNILTAINIFTQNISELDDEITSLSTIRDILKKFADELSRKSGISFKSDLLNNSGILSVIAPLPSNNINLKEKQTMENLNNASEKLNKLTDRDIRIVYLPPATVASSHYIGDEPEHHAGAVMDKFVRESRLPEIKPDMRQYGFNHPNEVKGTDKHGYEFWVTIPDDMEVPEPLVKKHFEGGLYAAHMIPMGAFEEWELLIGWVFNNDKYDANLLDDGGEFMSGLLEEHLNYRNNAIRFKDGHYDNVQLDLLAPIKEKDSAFS